MKIIYPLSFWHQNPTIAAHLAEFKQQHPGITLDIIDAASSWALPMCALCQSDASITLYVEYEKKSILNYTYRCIACNHAGKKSSTKEGAVTFWSSINGATK